MSDWIEVSVAHKQHCRCQTGVVLALHISKGCRGYSGCSTAHTLSMTLCSMSNIVLSVDTVCVAVHYT